MWSIVRTAAPVFLQPLVRTMGPAVTQPLVQGANHGYTAGISSWFSTLCRIPNPSTFLLPQPAVTTQVAGMKVVGLVKERCKGCRKYMKDERMFIYCMNHRKHNQKSLVKKHYNRWHLTHATQHKIRPW